MKEKSYKYDYFFEEIEKMSDEDFWAALEAHRNGDVAQLLNMASDVLGSYRIISDEIGRSFKISITREVMIENSSFEDEFEDFFACFESQCSLLASNDERFALAA